MRLVKWIAVFVAVAFLMPMAAAAGWWASVDRPSSWRSANWSSTGLLPPASKHRGAGVYILSARTGGFKGAFAVHSWIVLKDQGTSTYERYEKVGWGKPVRRDAYDADAAWYSNQPWVVAGLEGAKAETVLTKVRSAIASYPFAERGDYHIWPGPNSNSFVAYVLRHVPELNAVLPPNAVGRDYPSRGWFAIDPDGRDIHLSLAGFIGLSAGWRSGLEFNLLGQTAGVDIARPALKIPAIGRVGL